MELNDKEKIALYSFLRKNEKDLDRILNAFKYRLEKELFKSLTIEEIQVIDSCND